MSPGNLEVCPTCGSRVKASWETCARCGEPLVDDDASFATDFDYEGDTYVEEEPAEPPAEFPWNAVLSIVALLFVGYVSLTYLRTTPTEPNPNAFTFPTQPPAPAAPAAPSRPGAAAFAEGRRLLDRGEVGAALAFLAEAAAADPRDPTYRFTYGR